MVLYNTVGRKDHTKVWMMPKRKEGKRGKFFFYQPQIGWLQAFLVRDYVVVPLLVG
jgi:hypothetical protein